MTQTSLSRLNALLGFITLLLVLVLGACTNRSKLDPTDNLAAQVVLAAEPDAKCSPLYEGAGSNVLYSALCRFPNKSLTICSMSTDKGFECPPLTSSQAQTARFTGSGDTTATGSGSGK